MLTVLIVMENPAFGKLIEQRLLFGHSVPAGQVHLFPVGAEPKGHYILREFRRLYEEIVKYIRSDSAEGTAPLLVVTDLQGYDQFDAQALNPLQDNGWGSVLGMLILSFPEVHWAFAGCRAGKDLPSSLQPCFLGQDANFSHLLEWMEGSQICPLFDPCGLRNTVRKISGTDQHVIPVRYEGQAAAIDDEREYAFLHSYVAYRFGFCCHVVTSSQMMSQLFSGEAKYPIQLVFEDLFLNFADLHIPGLSDLVARDEQYPKLAAIPMRFIVTTGSERPHDDARVLHNQLYLADLNVRGTWTTVIRKPVPGIFKLWESSGISRHVRETARREGGGVFVRLPRPHSGGREASHSTPGRLVEIAKLLLDRAAAEQHNSRSACSPIYRALLATDALELLGGKTPTTSLLALAESHELEALAECQFLGVEGDFDVGLRLSEIRREIGTLSLFYGRPSREFSAWNAESSITQRLVQTFRNHNKFNEERIVEIREREIHRRLWFRRHMGIFGGMLRWLNPAYAASWYVEMLMRSMANFVFAIVLWLVGLTIVYASLLTPPSWPAGLEDAIFTFFTMQSSLNQFSKLGVEFVGLVGLLHLGVLIAHLYAVISRR